jgi:glutathione S-transferase
VIDLYYFPTPNGLKITLFLEEASLSYRAVPVDVRNGRRRSRKSTARPALTPPNWR